MKKITLFAALFLTSTLVWAQNRETRNVETFTKISYRVSGNLYLKQGSPQKIELEGPADVLRKIETEVRGGKLVIGQEDRWTNWNWNDKDRVNVYVTMTNIEALSVSGSGNLVAQDQITTGNLDLNVRRIRHLATIVCCQWKCRSGCIWFRRY